jgi:hypothetical protein
MSAFKKLFTDIISADGDASKLSKDISKQMLKVFVKETQPYFLVSDSYFYVPAYFTQAALDEFKKKNPSHSLNDLAEKVVLISNWSLELKRVDSNAVFTSYSGLEVRLIIHGFKPQFQEALHPTRYPTNLYRDDEFKTTIQHFRHRSVQASLASLKSDDQPLAGKGEPIVSGKDDWHFKEGTTKVADLSASRPKAAASGSAKVKGGAAVKRVSKAVAKDAKKGAKTSDKVASFTPSKKITPAQKGKKSVSAVTKKNAPTPTGGKKETPSAKISMQTFKQFLSTHKAGGKAALGKRSAGKKSAK